MRAIWRCGPSCPSCRAHYLARPQRRLQSASVNTHECTYTHICMRRAWPPVFAEATIHRDRRAWP
eukprot:18059-Eustigmatos_ZCMA.PRE.1